MRGEPILVNITDSLMSMMSVRVYQQHAADASRNMERLATGKRINHAKDDPSGLIASIGLAGQAAGIRKETEALKRTNTMLAAKGGAYSAVADMAQELNGLVVQAANKGAMGAGELDALQTQADGILKGLQFAASNSEFNGEKLLGDGWYSSLGSVTVTPSDAAGPVTYTLQDILSGRALDFKDGDLSIAQQVAQQAIKDIAEQEAAVGTVQNMNDSRIRLLQSELESTEKAKSKILDTDYAKEVSEYVRNQVLAQAAIFVIQTVGQTNANTVLSLLAGAKSAAAPTIGASAGLALAA